ncbi:UDP-3-O-(3-hydroxymyristoyl)glucosamine N-acyltransferase [candidate division TA06 bacterium B3_TA06]|uniref:UDP-3-O-(3-hydroxymyristoyl)glucosamine N-acyltransferase n=1 Tax=candidate division TA06 bacterium B3_TA06 TaxID=2012487 RepID=A0A532V6B1_UNCT6|nr:MAG: UDP-3-O-(3-hydroxymyristoyl)glucosamine N-acyltransferase [candidate division TA06 bacterium B3_TA06]
MTAGELARLLGGELLGDGGVELVRPAAFEEASPDELTFYDGDDTAELSASHAGCIITGLYPERFSACSIISLHEVRQSWVKALETFPRASEEQSPDLVYVSDSALVDSSSVILPFTYVGPEVRIGPDCLIGPNATIHARSKIGARVKIGAGSVIGSPGFGYVQDPDGNHHHIPHLGRVVIEEDVEIAAGVCIDRGTVSQTVIGKGTKIDNLVHIAHNVRVGKNCLITGQCGIAGSSVLEDKVVLAGQVGVKDHVHIGEGAVVLAKSAVFKNIGAGEVVSGIPARPHRLTLRAQARLFRDDPSKDN